MTGTASSGHSLIESDVLIVTEQCPGYAGCLTRALANTLGWGNHQVDRIETTVSVDVDMGERSPVFRGMHIVIRAKVPGIKPNQFSGLVNAAKTGCMISRWLKIEPTLDAQVDAD